MTHAESLLVKGTKLNDRIFSLVAFHEGEAESPRALVLSFDLYCLLLEYSLLVDQLRPGEVQSIEELFACDELIFDAGTTKLRVSVNFFAAPNSVSLAT